MNRLLLLSLITLFTFSYAKIVNGIAAIVEGEPITTAELHAVQTQMHLSKEKAMDLLIQDRLQKSAMQDVKVDEKAIDSKIAAIAAQNSITVPKMQQILLEQGTPWHKYRANIRNTMKKEKFFQANVAANIPQPSETELKRFYLQHKETFILPKTIKLVEYSAKTEKQMKDFLTTRNAKGLKHHALTKQTRDLNPTLLRSIMQTQNGSFTRPFNAGDRYISYKVLSKEGETVMPFEQAQGAVMGRWRQQQQQKALRDYFEKLKTNADIQILR